MKTDKRRNPAQPATISNELKDFFNRVDIQIMISDLETDEILFANPKMNEAYGVDYDPTGKRCWEAYQTGQSGRCVDCPLNKIRMEEGQTFEWEKSNVYKNRWFRNTSSLVHLGNGKLVHFEQGEDITEVKNASLKQKESEAYAQLMLDSTPLISSIWDAEGKMIDCNLAALKYFEVKHKSDYIDHFEDLNPEYQPNGISTKELAATYIKQTLETGYQRFFWQYLTHTGEPLPVETTLIRVPWENNYRLLAYSQDLRDIYSERAKAQAATEYTQVLLDSTPLICVVWDESGNPVETNLRTLHILGMKDKNVFLEHFFDYAPSYQPDGMLSTTKASLLLHRAQEMGTLHSEWEFQSQSGESVPTDATYLRLPWKSSYRIFSYYRDVRRVKKAEGVVEKYTNLLKVANTVAVALMASSIEDFDASVTKQLEALGNAVGVDHVRIWKNVTRDDENFHRLVFRWKKSDAYLGDISSLNHEINHKLLPNHTERLLKFDTINELLHDMPYAEQSYLAQRDIKALLLFPITIQGKLWGFISFCNCSNETLISDPEVSVLKSSSNMLASAIIQHDINLKLAKATEEALANVRAKNDFLARMSHELRTPMNAIINMTTIAQKRDDINNVKEALNVVVDSAQQLLNMLNDLLDMSSLGLDCTLIEREHYDIHQMVDSVISLFKKQLEHKKQNFHCDIQLINNHAIVGDSKQTAKIISNLLSNAIKFTPEGGNISLMLSERLLIGSNAMLTIKVTDNGIGVDKHFASHIFDLFEQEDGGCTRSHGGIGVGLSIVKSLVTLMGGTISLESEVEKGSCFTVELPVTFNVTIEADSQQSINAASWADKHVLLVEDVEINRLIATEMMLDTGVNIDCAENGKQALDMFLAAPEKYDLILMDLQMPIMGGLEATQQIRASNTSRASTVPIYAMTANTYKKDVDECKGAGMNGHIPKPIDMKVLLQSMQDAFSLDQKNS